MIVAAPALSARDAVAVWRAAVLDTSSEMIPAPGSVVIQFQAEHPARILLVPAIDRVEAFGSNDTRGLSSPMRRVSVHGISELGQRESAGYPIDARLPQPIIPGRSRSIRRPRV
jgi:hypothetical protein